MKLPVSLVIITLNEESHISRCIQSVSFASEIVVVDSGSTDRTIEAARSLGARVDYKAFNGYREQKQHVTDQAKFPWVLSLDADEFLSPELHAEILELFQKGGHELKAGYRMPRCSFHMGRWIRHGGWYPDYQTRLFRKEKARWVGERLHEKVEVNGELGTLKKDIKHFVFADLSEQVETNNKFSTLGAQEYMEAGKRFTLLKLLLRPPGKFLECYIFKLGFMDGLPGFIIAIGAAYSLFLRYSKMWETQASGAPKKG